MSTGTAWRAEDEALLERLEDEALLARLFEHHVGTVALQSGGARPHARAAGLVAAARKEPGGDAAVTRARSGDVVSLVRFLEAPPLRERRAELLHHLALHHALVARTLETFAPEAAANAWMRSLAAWLALGEERAYLLALTDAILGNEKKDAARIPPERVPLEVIADVGKRAESTARELAPSGRAALLALAWIDEAARIAGVSEDAKKAAHREAERRRNAAVEAALSAVNEAFEDAKARGTLAREGRSVLVRALEIWAWSAHDEAVEHFCVDRLGTVGWELYRARDWDALRHLLEPFRGMIDHLATRIERDPSKIAYAAACAEMYVFLSDVDTFLQQKVEYAERSVRVCPTHRNGRLTLASLLCDEAMTIMRGSMSVIARKSELQRVEALLARAEKLYPQATDLPEAKAMLDKVKRGSIALG
jgi:hypothetical protein